jgi:hypothetical protein
LHSLKSEILNFQKGIENEMTEEVWKFTKMLLTEWTLYNERQGFKD